MMKYNYAEIREAITMTVIDMLNDSGEGVVLIDDVVDTSCESSPEVNRFFLHAKKTGRDRREYIAKIVHELYSPRWSEVARKAYTYPEIVLKITRDGYDALKGSKKFYGKTLGQMREVELEALVPGAKYGPGEALLIANSRSINRLIKHFAIRSKRVSDGVDAALARFLMKCVDGGHITQTEADTIMQADRFRAYVEKPTEREAEQSGKRSYK